MKLLCSKQEPIYAQGVTNHKNSQTGVGARRFESNPIQFLEDKPHRTAPRPNWSRAGGELEEPSRITQGLGRQRTTEPTNPQEIEQLVRITRIGPPRDLGNSGETTGSEGGVADYSPTWGEEPTRGPGWISLSTRTRPDAGPAGCGGGGGLVGAREEEEEEGWPAAWRWEGG